MEITPYKLGARWQPGLERVQRVADNCAGIVIRELGEGTGQVEIRVTDKKHFAEAVITAEQQAIDATGQPLLSDGYNNWGFTTVSARGAVMVIDVESCRSSREIDRTLIHEFVHAAQFRRFGVRDQVLAGIANSYGLERLTRWQVSRLNRQVATREREARSLERFARQLRHFS